MAVQQEPSRCRTADTPYGLGSRVACEYHFLARWNVAHYFQGGDAPQRPHEVVALVGSRLVGPNLPRG